MKVEVLIMKWGFLSIESNPLGACQVKTARLTIAQEARPGNEVDRHDVEGAVSVRRDFSETE